MATESFGNWITTDVSGVLFMMRCASSSVKNELDAPESAMGSRDMLRVCGVDELINRTSLELHFTAISNARCLSSTPTPQARPCLPSIKLGPVALLWLLE